MALLGSVGQILMLRCGATTDEALFRLAVLASELQLEF